MVKNLVFLPLLLASLRKNETSTPKKNQVLKDVYDYVIVGGGTAGAVMANRLSEKSCVNVLLIEAGPEPPILTDIPSASRKFYQTDIDWAYKTTPQKYSSFALKDNRVILNNGKVLGGSSVLNAMLYVRGNKRNYDEWEAEGATGWSYKDVFPYFLKLEDNRNIDVLDEGYHQTGGPMTAERINYTPEIKIPLLQATKDMGYESIDINGRRQTGIYELQATARNQQRCNTAKAYLNPVRNRPNLDILTNAYARKVLISERSSVKRAYGVEFDYKGETRTVRARKEVVLSTGAIKTPQLLMLSGIGPKEELKKFNIKVIADLPVGLNFQDHVSSHLIYTVNETITPATKKNLLPSNVLDYFLNRRGPLASPTQVTLMAFLDGLNTTSNTEDFPRQELHFCEYETIDTKYNFNLKDEVFDRVYAPYLDKPAYICFISALQPYSRGEVTLNSTDPYDDPIINPNYLKDERDVKEIVEGMKICNAIAKHPAMRQVQAKLLETMRRGYPNCEKYDEEDEDAYLACLARQAVNTFWHYSGTARMGSRNDPRSVVDPQLRVIGVEGLRVVSAAVFPIVPSANTNVPTMMVAEKASDYMKNDIMCRRT